MDPLTQGALGAALPQAANASRYAASAGLLGFLAGMAADLDVLIRSSEDPLLFLEYHRQFTHSLVFIPAGGLLCALVLHHLIGRRRGLAFRHTWLFCTLGYATQVVSVTVLIFFLLIGFVFWLASLGSKRDWVEEEAVETVPEPPPVPAPALARSELGSDPAAP